MTQTSLQAGDTVLVNPLERTALVVEVNAVSITVRVDRDGRRHPYNRLAFASELVLLAKATPRTRRRAARWARS